MNDLALAGALFFVLCGAAALGSYVKAKLPEKHRSPETMAIVQVTISLLVTFTSIVLGLLTGDGAHATAVSGICGGRALKHLAR
jgi:hypothetical protein